MYGPYDWTSTFYHFLMTVNFNSNGRLVNDKTIHIGSEDRPLLLHKKALHFWPDTSDLRIGPFGPNVTLKSY